jgi:WD40 repeat protein/tetratricopeptide (TPR) repeat protein
LRLRKLNRAVPLDLETIVHKAIAQEPNQRYQSAAALAEDLNRFCDGRPMLARRDSVVRHIWRWSKRNPLFAAAVSTAVASLVTVAVGSVVYAIGQPHASERVEQLLLQSRHLSIALKKSLMESDRRLAAINLERGQAACEKGELGLGLLWMTESWRLANDVGDLAFQQAARGNIAAWQGEHPRLRAIFSHGGGLTPGAVAFSPDGRTVVTGSYDNTARLWDTTTGLPKGAELRHQSSVWVVAFAPDGGSVLTADDEGTTRIWDAGSGAVLREFPRHGGMIQSAVFSFDGKKILTGSADQTARLWDVATGKPIGPPLVHRGAVQAVSLSPDGQVALTGSKDNTARLWNPFSAEPLNGPLEHEGSVSAVAFSPDGKSVLTGGGNSGRVWDVATGKARTAPLLHQGDVIAVAYSGDGKTVLTGSCDHTARLWDAETGEPVGLPLRHGDVVSAVAFSPDSRMAFTGSWDHTARVWDAATGEILDLPRQHRAAVQSVAFSPDGKTLVTGSMDGTARLWNAATRRPLPLILRHPSDVRAVTFSPDGKTALTGCDDRTVRLWDVATGRPQGIFQMPNSISVIAYSPDGTKVLAADVEGTIKLWNPTTLRPEGRVLNHPARVDSAIFSPDGSRVLSGGWDGTARLWDIQNGRQIGDPLKHDGAIGAVAFNEDGTVAVTGSWDNTARLWDLASGSLHGLPLRHRHRVATVVFSPDGTRVLTGSWDNTARLWEVATGQPVGSPMKHDKRVLVVGFSPDGQTILTGSDDNSARLWDVATCQPIGSPLRHASPIQAAAFSRDSQIVLTGSADKTARLWGAASGQPLGPVLAHEGSVFSVSFSPDGHTFLTGSGDGAARLWSLATLPDDQRKIAAWVEVLTGLELTGGDRIRILDGQQWLERRDALRRQGGVPVVRGTWHLDLSLPCLDPLERPRAWIKRRRWAEAEAAYNEAVSARPFDTAILIERARFLLDRNRPEAAEADFARAYTLGYRNLALESRILTRGSLFQLVVAASPEMAASLYAMRASLRVENQLWSDAEADFSRALQLEPNEPKYWIERGLLHARRADSGRAAADLGRACRLLPDDMLLAAQWMTLLADAGELLQFRRGAEHLLHRASETTSPDVACFLALALIQSPGSTVDWQPVVRLGRFAVSKNAGNACYRHVLAGALLRAGEYREALDELDRSDQIAGKWQARELNDAMRPLVLHKLGRDHESRIALGVLRRWSRDFPGSTSFGRWASEWWWWYRLRVLRREAEAAVLLDPAFPADPLAP